MKRNNGRLVFYIAGIVAGIAAVLLGAALRDQASKEIVGACFGLGSGAFGMFTAKLITSIIEARNPEAVRVKNIAVNDERNEAIRDKAGAQANRVLGIALPLVTVVFAFMNVELIITLIMCGLILLRAAVSIYYTGHYDKRM